MFSQTDGHARLRKAAFERADVHLAVVEDAGGKPRVHPFHFVKEGDEILRASGAARGDDGDAHRGAGRA